VDWVWENQIWDQISPTTYVSRDTAHVQCTFYQLIWRFWDPLNISGTVRQKFYI